MVFLADTTPLVLYPDDDLGQVNIARVAFDSDIDGSAWGTVLDSIADEVIKHLPDGGLIARSEKRLVAGVDHEPMFGGDLTLLVYYLLYQRNEIHPPILQWKLPASEA